MRFECALQATVENLVPGSLPRATSALRAAPGNPFHRKDCLTKALLVELGNHFLNVHRNAHSSRHRYLTYVAFQGKGLVPANYF